MSRVLITAYVDSEDRDELRRRGINLSCFIRGAMHRRLESLAAKKNEHAKRS